MVWMPASSLPYPLPSRDILYWVPGILVVLSDAPPSQRLARLDTRVSAWSGLVSSSLLSEHRCLGGEPFTDPFGFVRGHCIDQPPDVRVCKHHCPVLRTQKTFVNRVIEH